MRTTTLISALLCAGLFIFSCDTVESDVELESKGMLEFKTSNSITSAGGSNSLLKFILTNPPLVGDTTITNTTSLKLCVGDVWVSQGEVKDGETDNMVWIRLTRTTNKNAKLFEDYSFTATEIPIGSYKSMKITFRNVFYRYAQLVSDPTVAYELLETMGSWTTPCDVNDTSWARTNYFGPDGNHILNDNQIFEMVSSGEKIGGFTIEPDKAAIVTWRLFAGITTPCITYLIDENSNLAWDCGIDRMDEECPPEMKYMWDFVVEYE